MFYTVYKITNMLDNKEYIGIHRTLDIHDNYMGSGVYIRRAIRKYGIENFKKETLFVFDNETDMFNKEIELVNEEYVKSNLTYNMTIGGRGSWAHIDASGVNNPNYGNHQPLSEEHKAKIGNSVRGENNGMYGRTHTEEVRRKLSEINSQPWEVRLGADKADELRKVTSERFKNKEKSEEQKRRMSESAKLAYKNMPDIECPHCGKVGKSRTLKRWHFDHCKYKVNK